MIIDIKSTDTIFTVLSVRTLGNDFAKSNPYPSAAAINMPRNKNDLKELLR